MSGDKLRPIEQETQALRATIKIGRSRAGKGEDAGADTRAVGRAIGHSDARNGQPVSVERGDIRLFINLFADSPGVTEPSFRAGYTLTTDSPATVTIGGAETPLYPNAAYCTQDGAIDRCDQYAWTEPDDDAGLVAAMKGGREAVVTARSQRGTITTDTFSLTGFTAALNDAIQACSQ